MFGSKFECREPDIFDGRTDGRTSIPRLVGASDWSAQTILVHLPSSLGLDVGSSGEYVLSDRLFDNLADHVSVLCEHIFLSSKPGKPSASRWTGIAGVTRWCLQLAFFHRLFKPLMKALVSGNKANAQEEAVSLHGDVRG